MFMNDGCVIQNRARLSCNCQTKLSWCCLHCPTSIQIAIKIACMELCRSVHTAQRQITTQIAMVFCTHFIVLCLYRSLSVNISLKLNALGMCRTWVIKDQNDNSCAKSHAAFLFVVQFTFIMNLSYKL